MKLHSIRAALRSAPPRQRRMLRPVVSNRPGVELLEDRCVPTTVTGPEALGVLSSLAVDPGSYDPTRILVRFRDDANDLIGSSILSGTEIGPANGLVSGLRVVGLTESVSVEDALAAYRSHPLVVYAEPNFSIRVMVTPDDPDFSSLYGLHNTGQTGGTPDADIDAPEAWNLTTGSDNIIVAVIDTGVDYTHQDLAANMWTNAGETPNDGQDNDGNGIVDDYYGANFAYRDGNGSPTGDPFDDHYHGTHVAGTIGAVGDNGIGVVGVNWNVRIMALKFLDAGGYGYTEDAIDAFKYVTMMRENGVNVRLTSNSWGGGEYSQALLDAINAAGAAGVLSVMAAGNSGVDADSSPMYPAAYDSPYILSVAATDHDDAYAYFSNWGANSVDLAAPGVDIYSTLPDNTYGSLSGTSMATPHVSGAAALVWSLYPNLSPLQVRQRLMGGADSIGDIGNNASRPTVTNGRLNAFNALEEDAIGPAAVTDLAVDSSGLFSVTLTWTATGDDGSTGLAASYDIRYSTSPISDGNWDTATPASGESRPQAPGSAEAFTVTGLNHSSTYYFAVRVADNVGNSSAISNVTQASTQAATTLFEDDMEGGAPGWSAEGSPGLWHLAGWRSSSPTTAFYYGDDASLTYNTFGTNWGALTSPPIDLSGSDEAYLTFYEFRQVENLAPYDQAQVQLSSDGINWTTVWESYSSTNAWVQRSIDLNSWVGGDLSVRFYFDTVDEAYNDYEGWYVDDLAVLVPGSLAPGLYVKNVSVVEGNAGTVEATFTVRLVDVSTAVSVDWATADGSASGADNDYEPAGDTFNFAAGVAEQTFTVLINGDWTDEGNESFSVLLGNAVGADIIDGEGLGTIVDDDTAGITLDPASGLVTTEGGGTATFTVVLDSRPTANVTINLSSNDSSEGTMSPASLVFTSSDWDVPRTITVTGVNDSLDDGDVSYVISAAATSSDSNYSVLQSNLAAVNQDNDFSVTYTSTDVPKVILDAGKTSGRITSTLNAGAHTILDVNVKVSLTHARTDELDVFLSGANGTKVELFTDVGANGKNFVGTVLDDEAGTPITAGAAPFAGVYRPEGSLAAFDGMNSQGAWVLEVLDDQKGTKKGSLNGWSITIVYEQLNSSTSSSPDAHVADARLASSPAGPAADTPASASTTFASTTFADVPPAIAMSASAWNVAPSPGLGVESNWPSLDAEFVDRAFAADPGEITSPDRDSLNENVRDDAPARRDCSRYLRSFDQVFSVLVDDEDELWEIGSHAS